MSSKKLEAEKVEPKVEAVGSDGVTVLASGMGMRNSEGWLTLLLVDSLFFLKPTPPNQLDDFPPVDFVMTDLSADEDERRVEVDPRLECCASSTSLSSRSFSLRAFLSPTFSVLGSFQVTSNMFVGALSV